MATVVWSAEQVLALAPDPSSAKSGKDLSAPRKWVSMGQGEGILWGECQGSGSKPYQVKIEWTEPAFQCSCPSRKFPCKHALGLFLIWAGQPSTLPTGDPPAWVASWLEGRSKRAEQKAAKDQAKQEKIERGEPTVNAAARQKREDARRAKVADGLEELDRWLSDMIRQGLVSIANQPPSFWDERARRLIDAQAPGVARRIRQIADLPTTGEGWQAATLDKLSRLHLLIQGHRRIESLPTDAQLDLRAAIGYPVDLDEVRAGSGVRDLWRVIGQRTETEERLRVRRTWLTGRDTGRLALILEFTHMSQQAADVALPPGTAIDADLAFFPSAFPLRALLKERHGLPASTAEIGGVPRVEDAVNAWADAITRDPWIETFPIVFADVVPLVRDGAWFLRDASGGVLPLSPRFSGGWNLLAAGGGHPMTVAAEFDGATVSPLSFVVDGRFCAIPWPDTEARAVALPSPEGPPELTRTWLEATASALVGVARKPLVISGNEGSALGQTLKQVKGSESEVLLGTSALMTFHGRIGRKPASDANPPPEACGIDELPEASPEQAARLHRMLGGELADLIPEWLGLLALAGRRLANDSLVDVLALGRRQSDLRPLLRPVLGTRGRWLAAQNPAEWGYVGGDADRADPELVWQTGTKAERLVALRSLRVSDPEKARHLVATTWASESADDRCNIIEAFVDGLSMTDEPFLEAALDDRAKTVRKAAAEQLAGLVESRLATRMAERTRAFVQWNGTAAVVELPKECDAAMIRDGIEPKPPTGTGERAWWLQQVVSATPLGFWSTPEFPPLDRLIEAIWATEWADDFANAWSRAAARERDPAWAEFLFRRSPRMRISDTLLQLLEALKPEQRDALILDLVQADPNIFRPLNPTLQLLRHLTTPMGETLAREIVRRFLKDVAATRDKSRYDHDILMFFRTFSRLLPPILANEIESLSLPVSDSLTYLHHHFTQFVDTVRFRREMHEEFAR